jgi:cellobiose-specific phosphotransferase system component IIC
MGINEHSHVKFALMSVYVDFCMPTILRGSIFIIINMVFRNVNITCTNSQHLVVQSRSLHGYTVCALHEA